MGLEHWLLTTRLNIYAADIRMVDTAATGVFVLGIGVIFHMLARDRQSGHKSLNGVLAFFFYSRAVSQFITCFSIQYNTYALAVIWWTFTSVVSFFTFAYLGGQYSNLRITLRRTEAEDVREWHKIIDIHQRALNLNWIAHHEAAITKKMFGAA